MHSHVLSTRGSGLPFPSSPTILHAVPLLLQYREIETSVIHTDSHLQAAVCQTDPWFSTLILLIGFKTEKSAIQLWTRNANHPTAVHKTLLCCKITETPDNLLNSLPPSNANVFYFFYSALPDLRSIPNQYELSPKAVTQCRYVPFTERSQLFWNKTVCRYL